MPNPDLLLPSDQRQRVNTALAQTPQQTAVRITPVLARQSGSYERPEDLAGLLTGLWGGVCAWLLIPSVQNHTNSWAGLTPSTKLALVAASLACGFVAGSVLSAHCPPLRRLFTPAARMRRQVAQAAHDAFDSVSLTGPLTTPRLLIYLSLYERRVTLLADPTTHNVLTQAHLDTLCRDLATALRHQDPAEALCQTIRRAATLLEGLPPVDGAEMNTQLHVIL